MRSSRLVHIVALLAVMALASCGGSSSKASPDGGTKVDAALAADAAPPDRPADKTPPTFGAIGIARYELVKGTAEITAEVSDDSGKLAKVELLAGGQVVASDSEAPFAFSWDSTAAADGVVALKLRAADEAGNSAESAELPVLVLNRGESAVIKEGEDGVVSIPANYKAGMEIDTKHHFYIRWPDVKKVVGVLTWDQPGWTFEWSCGTGFCPHSGVKLADVTGDTGELVVEYASPEGNFTQGEQWFLHIKPMNPEDHKGQDLPVKMVAVLLR
jgi:hypothetical protein